jgi:ankyrin repeat protein
MQNIDTLTPNELVDKLKEVAKIGNASFLHDFLKSDWISESNIPRFEKLILNLLEISCIHGSLDIVKNLFNSVFEPVINSPHKIQCFFTHASKNGHIDIVKYLIDTPAVKIGDNFTTPQFGAMVAAEHGHLDIVKYLLDPNKNYLVNSIQPESEIFESACRKNNLPILQYLVTLPNYNVQKNIEKGFESSLYKGNLDNLKYIVFDLNIERNSNVNFYLKKYKNDEVERMFQIRDLHNNLHSNMELNTSVNKKPKV